MKRNKLRDALAAGEPTLGTQMQSSWPSIVEVAAKSGAFDYVEFLAEYAPFDLFSLENFCRAAELHGLGTMIKVDPEPSRFLAQRAIGCGFDAVLFAGVRSAEEATECVRAVRPDTPADGGVHGVAARRITYMLQGGTPDYVEHLRAIVVAIMIEKRAAVDRLEEILAVPGIDLVQWGPADYSMSDGRAGEKTSPETRAVERRVIRACAAAGIPARAEIQRPEQAREYLDMGVRHFCLGTDINVLYAWYRDNGLALRDSIALQRVVSGG